MDRRQSGSDDARDRIQGYLDRSGLAAGKPRVVPLTGDASDRRYFRILLPDVPSIVLALNSAPFDVTRLPFVNVATLMAKMPVPIPAVLCHRDYHSRNLMLHEAQLYIIDFQDARMGPDTYDLVSLLRDSYVDLPEHTVDELIAYFLALKGVPGPDPAFRRRFDVMAL